MVGLVARRLRLVVASAAVLAGLALPASASAIVYAITTASPPRLISFDQATPTQLLSNTTVTGLDAGEVVRGMDLRPATGSLVLLTTDSGGAARLRTLDAGTGAVTAPMALAADPADGTSPYTGLTPGTGVGIDVNPTVDRLRVVTATRQSLRVNLTNGLTITDSDINPGTPEMVAVAYTNSFAGATSTTLFDVDVVSDSLYTQNPPNNGVVNLVGAGLGIGNLTSATFDISPNGTVAFLAAQVGAVTALYTVNLAAGTATLVGNVGDGTAQLNGMAVANNVIRPSTANVVQGEAAGTATLTLERISPHLGAQVDYATANGSAVAGSDYEARSGTVIFSPGQTSQTITVPLIDSADTEEAETFSVVLSNADPDLGTTATLPGPAATVSITDDDPAPPPPDDDPTPTPPPDRDGDGVPDATDTCPNIADPSQADADKDGIGTACDVIEPVADTTGPTILGAASEIRRRRLRTKGLPVRFSCSEGCVIDARLVAGRKTAAKKKASLGSAGRGKLVLKPTKAGRRAIGTRRRVKVVLTGRDGAGNRATYSFSVRVI